MKSSLRMRPSIVLFGDSITEEAFGVGGHVGWASLLAADYSRRADVLNRGYAGYNSRLAIDLLPRVFAGSAEPCLFCTVFFGANDAALPGERQHVPVDDYGANLVKIVDHMRGALGETTPTVPILLMTPPPFDAKTWMAFREVDTPGRDNAVSQAYGDKVKEVAANLALCSVVDTWALLEGSSENRSQYLSDGLHLNEVGNRAVHKGIVDVLSKDYPAVLPMLDGDGRNGTRGVPLEEKLWRELC
jgi:lysophospholipase L1-like esterase